MRAVQAKLAAAHTTLDPADLEACYSQAWQGLYGEVLAGARIDNPAGWLVLVTYRRAIDEQRSQARARRGAVSLDESQSGVDRESGREVDFAGDLDDRRRLRSLMEGLSGRLDGAEREAAVLCYLQGLTRAEAAQRMGLSARRMRRLMEGRSGGRPGVAAKVGLLVESVGRDEWCKEQSSMIRAYAFGVLSPAGDRERLAEAHLRACPACRAQVAALRGLASAMPPWVLPWKLGTGLLARTAHAGGSAGAGAGAGGGWALASGTGASKLALGCAVALTVGAGCVALEGPDHRAPARRTPAAHLAAAAPRSALADVAPARSAVSSPKPVPTRRRASRAAVPVASTPQAAAQREFGPEQPPPSPPAPPVARAASTAAAQSKAEREFTPG